ncbi:hypothetical protein GCM10023187_45620 [Nibrella viscosa]|uniref:Uncharacterized protein n=1 Tax=Nibrella viscosa TaxID=1084524 RepID=A0ABP8KTX6_9BACT
MEKNSKDFGAVKNSITGKSIREMTWSEIFSLAGQPMTQTEAIRHIKSVRAAREQNKNKQS